MKSLFIVNARSGRRRGYDVTTLIRETCAAWNDEFDVVSCARKEDLDEIVARAARDDYAIVYAVGGDGTVHETARRLIGTPLALGILPTGSGNGFARHIQLPMEPRSSLMSSSQRRIVTIDTATVNGAPFLGVMGVGFDAFVAERFAASGTRGFETYVKVGVKSLFTYRPESYELEIDGEPLTRRAYAIAIANASQYGNNARIAPLASLCDGLLDIVLVHAMPLWRVPFVTARIFAGSLQHSSDVTMRRGRHIVLRRNTEGAAHLDGEPVTLPAELTIRIVPQSLRILLPDRTATY